MGIAPAPTVAAHGIACFFYGQYRIEEGGTVGIPECDWYTPPRTMEEVRAVPQFGLVVASTFSGCGGSCVGWREAGFEVRWANEFVRHAAVCYRLNFPDTVIDPRDVRRVDPEDVLLALGMEVGELDVLEGSPPCDPFSLAGKRDKGWSRQKNYFGKTQRTDDLTMEFVRLLAALQPRAFVVENVKGLVQGRAKGYFREIFRAMQGAGYKVKCRVLDAQYLGVPQHRERAIFVGVRDNLAAEPAHPRPRTPPIPLAVALPHLAMVEEPVTGTITKAGIPPGGTRRIDPAVKPMVTVQSGGERQFVVRSRRGPGFRVEQDSVEQPSRTITCETDAMLVVEKGIAGPVLASAPRRFTIPELLVICGFPPDFRMTGSYTQRWERLGNSVPPPMMRAVAETLRDEVFAKLDA